ncbi:MAG: hypothetical protein ACPGIG_04270, partial [Candidatus Poseidoniaceae archaeon]
MEILRQHVEALLSPALAALGINNDHWKSMISVSREKNMGDLSLPCFAFAKQLSMAPNEIAEKLKAAIETNDVVDDINSTAGYLNFKASRNWLAEYIISGNIRIGDAEVNSSDGSKSVL